MVDKITSASHALVYRVIGTVLVLCVFEALCLPFVIACDTSSRGSVLSQSHFMRPSEISKDTNYPIPPQAYFVSPTGDDSNVGTQAAPFATIQQAVTVAPTDSTIVIRAGIYHESVDVYSKTLTLQPFPHEKAILDGAVIVSNWVSDSGLWRSDGWTHQFKQDGLPADALDPQYPFAGNPDMMFLNGQPLKQVADRSQVTAGKFYADYTDHALYIGDDPNGKTVEASAIDQAINIDHAPGTIIRGLAFIRYATSRDQYGAVKGDSDHLTFENNVFAWNAAAGLGIFEPDDVVRDNMFIYNGQIGLLGYQTDRLLFEQNIVGFNNQEHFNISWEAGGVKVSEAHDMIWRDNLVIGNIGKGMWNDGSCFNTTIVRNNIRDNTDSGISYEVSAKALIASNLITNNGGSGILVLESESISIYNNTLSINQWNIRIGEGDRVNPGNPTISWNVHDITIKNNILSDGDSSERVLFSVDDAQEQKSADQMGINMDNNAYYRGTTAPSSTLVLWAQWPSDVAQFATLDAFRASTGQEINGLGIDNVVPNPFFMNEASGDYSLKPTSPAIGRGEPLNNDIAVAIGVTAGVPVNLGMLRQPPMIGDIIPPFETPVPNPTSREVRLPVVVSRSL